MTRTDESLTTQIQIPADNQTLLDLLSRQYGRLESGEARALLEQTYARVWNEEELLNEFQIEHEDPPYVTVTRLDSGARGTLLCLEVPRFYFLFNPETVDEPRQAV